MNYAPFKRRHSDSRKIYEDLRRVSAVKVHRPRAEWRRAARRQNRCVAVAGVGHSNPPLILRHPLAQASRKRAPEGDGRSDWTAVYVVRTTLNRPLESESGETARFSRQHRARIRHTAGLVPDARTHFGRPEASPNIPYNHTAETRPPQNEAPLWQRGRDAAGRHNVFISTPLRRSRTPSQFHQQRATGRVGGRLMCG